MFGGNMEFLYFVICKLEERYGVNNQNLNKWR